MNYYNEFEPYAAQWLRNLIAAGKIPAGTVDERDIRLVQPADLKGFAQCHFFAGIAGWPLALRLAGWDESRPVWTGSCPCQPFSVAGKKKGESDARHLWPAFHNLIKKCRPPVVFGEQVASKDGRLWLSGVRSDLEKVGYGVGASDLCAASVSAPHVRQRLYWVADSAERGWEEERSHPRRGYEGSGQEGRSAGSPQRSTPAQLVNSDGYHEQWWSGPVQVGRNGCEAQITRSGRKYRAQWRIKPGLSIVAHGVPGRVGQLCAYGNAIVPQVGAEFILSYLEASRKVEVVKEEIARGKVADARREVH